MGDADCQPVLRMVAVALAPRSTVHAQRTRSARRGLIYAQVGLGEAEREAVLRTVAAVLHLGNIQFAPAADEGAAPVGAASAAAIAAVADLLEARCPRGLGFPPRPGLLPDLQTSPEALRKA